VAEGRFATLWQACDYVHEQFSIRYTQPGIWSLFRAMKVKLKTAPLQQYKQDQGRVEAFKKAFPSG